MTQQLVGRHLLAAAGLAGMLSVVLPAAADVAADCFDGTESFACALNRVNDARELDRLLKPILQRHGWSSGCYEVMYIQSDPGDSDAISLILNGPKRGVAPNCRTPTVARVPLERVKQIQRAGGGLQDVMRETSERTIKRRKETAATEKEMHEVADELRKVLLSSPRALRTRLLRNTNTLSIGSGFGGFEVPLP